MINLIDNFQPNRNKLYELHQLRRITVSVSVEAQQYIAQTTKEGRLFPLALSEIFGEHPSVNEISIDLVRKEQIHPWAEDPDTKILKILIKHADPTIEDGAKYINAQDLECLHPSGFWTFNAAETARELLRLHCIEKGL